MPPPESSAGSDLASVCFTMFGDDCPSRPASAMSAGDAAVPPVDAEPIGGYNATLPKTVAGAAAGDAAVPPVEAEPIGGYIQRCPKPSLGPFGLHATGWAAFPLRRAWARRMTPHSRERPVQTQRAPERAKSATALAERGEQSQKAKTASALQFGSARAQHPPRGPRELYAFALEGSAQPANAQSRAMA